MTARDGTVVVGMDDSPAARRALVWATDHCRQTDAELVAVHVLTYSRALVADLPPSGLTNWRQRLEGKLCGEWTEPARNAGVRVRCAVVEDESAAAGILDVSRREQADLIVLGASGDGGLADRLLGATPYRVAQRATTPVVVIPPGWTSTG